MIRKILSFKFIKKLNNDNAINEFITAFPQMKLNGNSEIIMNINLSVLVIFKKFFINWLRGTDLNRRPSGYEPDELPDCSTPRYT